MGRSHFPIPIIFSDIPVVVKPLAGRPPKWLKEPGVSIHLAVLVSVVDIRIVPVRMPYRRMPVPMRVRLFHRPLVGMLMMFVVRVRVLVFQAIVEVLVFMPLGKMQPQAECHQKASTDKLP